jgi:hypothetical protein
MNATRDGYEVDEERMAVVRRAVRMVGVEGAGIYSVHKATHYGRMCPETPSPRGCDSERCWQRMVTQECSFIRPEVCS